MFLFSIFAILSSFADPEPLEKNCPSAEQPTSAPVAKQRTGSEAYQEVCAMCHGAEGKGTPGVFPPLVPSEWVEDEIVLSNIILRGLAGEIFVNNERYASAMPGFHEKLSNQEVLGIVQFLQEKNGKRPTLSITQIQQIREKNVPLGSVSSQAGLEELRRKPTTKPPKKSRFFWKGCSSNTH